MALLFILFALLGFVFAGIGSGSSGTGAAPGHSSSSATATARSCSTVVTSINGKTVRKHSCSTTTGASTTVHSRAVVKCSVQMTNGTTKSRCSPPAKP